jgi:peptidoglycan/LPS O-acetylase OafA/YrhL
MKGGRLASVSVVRLVAFASIFVFHIFFFSTPIVSQAFFPFSAAVQSFFFLSAFLYSQKNVERKGFFKEELIKLSWPCGLYFLFLCLANGIYLLARGEGSTFETLKWAFGSMKYSGYAIQFGNLWFIPVLLVCYAVLPLLSYLRRKKLLVVVTILACEAEILVCLNLGEPMAAFPFLVGYAYGSQYFARETDPNPKENWAYYVLPALILAALIVLYDLAVNLGPFNTILQAPIGCLAVIVMLRFFRFLNAKKEPAWLTYLGKLTLDFYLVHETFMCGWTDLTASGNLAWGVPLVFLASFLSAVFLFESEQFLRNRCKLPLSFVQLAPRSPQGNETASGFPLRFKRL